MEDRYFHIKDILYFVNKVERKPFKIINSWDYGVSDDLAFKAIIPESFDVTEIKLSEDMDGTLFQILDANGNNAMEGPNALIWKSELFSTKEEEFCCLSENDINDGLLLFDNFRRIPEMVSSGEIIEQLPD